MLWPFAHQAQFWLNPINIRNDCCVKGQRVWFVSSCVLTWLLEIDCRVRQSIKCHFLNVCVEGFGWKGDWFSMMFAFPNGVIREKSTIWLSWRRAGLNVRSTSKAQFCASVKQAESQCARGLRVIFAIYFRICPGILYQLTTFGFIGIKL